ncbi:hypothetical protein ACFWZ2_37580 [Streptomyces sp. NPDC059002]|uniref:hypothetical protein n=1 Tax=Streptomyces sp. NPDC059002 TaxID=3346690 RepID=UPI0036C29172
MKAREVTPPESHDIALELAEPRRTLEVGFAEQHGELALLVHRGGQMDKALDEHEKRLDDLERSRWPLPSLATAMGSADYRVSRYRTRADPASGRVIDDLHILHGRNRRRNHRCCTHTGRAPVHGVGPPRP